MKLGKLLSMIIDKVDVVAYYNKNMEYLYSFHISEVPEDCGVKIRKFNIVESNNTRILQVIREKGK